MTKWDMTRVIAAALNLPVDHVTPQSEKPKVAPGQTERPWNTELSVTATEALGVSCADSTPFADWWAAYVIDSK
jgi:S-adenosylmethionine synthetase